MASAPWLFASVTDSPMPTRSQRRLHSGQEPDLVGQVAQLLKDYGRQSDLISEFVQNSDDFGASQLHFFLDTREYGCTQTLGLSGMQRTSL